LLSRRGAASAERTDLALPGRGRPVLCARPSARTRRQGSAWLGRIRNAGRAARDTGGPRGFPQAHRRQSRQLHCAVDPAAFDLSGHRRGRHRTAPCRSAPLRPQRARWRTDRTRRLDACRFEKGLARRQFEPGRRHQGHLGSQRIDAMLSRNADSLYWLSRYMERAENTARILDVAYRLSSMPASYGPGNGNEWESALATASALDLFRTVHDEATPENVIEFLVHS